MSYIINKKTYHKDSSASKWVEYVMCVMIIYTQQALLYKFWKYYIQYFKFHTD